MNTELIKNKIEEDRHASLEAKARLKEVWDAYRLSLTEEELEALYALNCPRCLSTKGQWRGYRRRKNDRIVHRRFCSACRKWFFVES